MNCHANTKPSGRILWVTFCQCLCRLEAPVNDKATRSNVGLVLALPEGRSSVSVALKECTTPHGHRLHPGPLP